MVTRLIRSNPTLVFGLRTISASIFFMVVLGGQAHAQMVPPRIVETIDIQVLMAINIVVGRVTGVTDRDSGMVVTIQPEDTLKGDPADSVRRDFRPTDVKPADLAAILAAKSRVLAMGPVFIALDSGKLAVPTAAGTLLRDPQAVIAYLVDVLRTFPGGAAVPTFRQPIPQSWGNTFASPYPASFIAVPVGPYLKKWAIDAFASGGNVDAATQASRPLVERSLWPLARSTVDSAKEALLLFPGEETIKDVLPFLNTPTYSVLTLPEMNFGIEVRSFPVRAAAYEILTAWGVAVEKPTVTEEVNRLAEVAEIVWVADRAPDDADVARLIEALKLERLEFSGTTPMTSSANRGFVTDSQMSTIGRLTNLKSLTLRGRQITDAGLDQILDLPHLEELDLSLTRISERGIAKLVVLPSLKRLMLAGTTLSDDNLREFVRFPRLEYVSAMLTRTTEEGATDVERSRPGLRIDRDSNDNLGPYTTMRESLSLAAARGKSSDLEQIRALIGGKFPSNPNELDMTGTPPIFYAVICRTADALQLLLDKKARVNITDLAGTTPLHWASRYGRTPAMKLLLDRQADPRAADNEGDTPLHFAAHQNDPEPVRMLLAAGADPMIRNKAGQTAMDIAKGLGREVVERILTGGTR